jgi:hypothetical protein
MVMIEIEGDRLVLTVEGWDKLWALRTRLAIPLAHVRGVHADPDATINWMNVFKLAGTHVPGLISAGTFYQREGLVFWDVHHPQRTIVIELEHEVYRRLIVEVEDPQAAVRTIEQALAARGPAT